MDDECERNEYYSIIKTAAIIAVIIAVVITGYLLIFTQEQHSALYIIPESYQNQAMDDRISFSYGVVCSEEDVTDYEVNIFLNNKLVHTEQFQLNDNQYYTKNEEISLPQNVTYPAKIQLILNYGIDTEEVHFWIDEQPGNSI